MIKVGQVFTNEARDAYYAGTDIVLGFEEFTVVYLSHGIKKNNTSYYVVQNEPIAYFVDQLNNWKSKEMFS